MPYRPTLSSHWNEMTNDLATSDLLTFTSSCRVEIKWTPFIISNSFSCRRFVTSNVTNIILIVITRQTINLKSEIFSKNNSAFWEVTSRGILPCNSWKHDNRGFINSQNVNNPSIRATHLVLHTSNNSLLLVKIIWFSLSLRMCCPKQRQIHF